MSNRAMARMYSGGMSGGYGGGADDGGLIGNIMDLFGGNDVTGGFTVDPATQQISATPYVGKGRKGKLRASGLNAQTLGPAYQAQTEGRTELEKQKMLGQQAQELEKIKSQHVVDLSKLDAVKAIAGKLGVTPEQYAGQLADQNASNALAATQNDATALKGKPGAFGAAMRASGLPPGSFSALAPEGGIAAMPDIGTDYNQLTGALKNKTTSATTIGGFKDANGNIVGGRPAVTEIDTQTPANMTKPLNPNVKNAVLSGQSVNPPVNPTPDFNEGLPSEYFGNAQPQVNAQPFGGAQGLIPQSLGMLQQNAPGIMQGLKQGAVQGFTGMTPEMQQYLYQLLWAGKQQQPQTNQGDVNSSAQYTKDLQDKILAQP